MNKVFDMAKSKYTPERYGSGYLPAEYLSIMGPPLRKKHVL
jgi:hypothetical protein